MKGICKTGLLTLFFCFFGFSQSGIAQKKAHYRIINESSEPTAIFEKAMLNTDLDSLRFIGERRKIPVDGSNLFIELYSANELFESYKKIISPLNIKNPSAARKVKLKLSPDRKYLRVLPLNEK